MDTKNEEVYFVLFDDGTWGGGFSKRKDAEICQRRDGGQIVIGRWFEIKVA